MDGLALARKLIAEEAEKKTGKLDLGNLGLTEVPSEVFQLTHLQELNLGGFVDEDAGYSGGSSNSLQQNSISIVPAEIQSLDSLDVLSLAFNPIQSLAQLSGLSQLQSLDCSNTEVSDLTPLARLPAFQSLDCSDTPVSDLAPLARLPTLQSLDCSDTQVRDLNSLSALPALQSLDCSSTWVSDLTPLTGLSALQSLDCSHTEVSDLTSLAGLSALQSLDCSCTKISDLQTLIDLPTLQSLDCSGTEVSDLEPLAELSALQSLDCSRTKVSDLEPLAGLSDLQSLDCSRTKVSDLQTLGNLPALRLVDCSATRVSNLEPLAGLSALQSLNCSNTEVSDLTPLSGLHAFRSLRCSNTNVSSLKSVCGLKSLRFLTADACQLDDLSNDLLSHATLELLVLNRAQIPGVPPEILSKGFWDNCLYRLRAHAADLRAGSAPLQEAKLVVLGNGRVGKTQLSRRLRGLPFDESIPSTHGITVTSTPWSGSDDTLNLWDFGGQDIYHGTHSLFLRTRAIFVIVWHPEAERATEHEHEGQTFRNYPLAYWLDYVRTLGGKDSPVIVVQTRCDRPELEAKRLPVPDAFLEFPFLKQCCFSAAKDRGVAALREAITDAIAHLRDRHEGIAVIGQGRMKVLQKLKAWREADEKLPTAERQHRTLTVTEFNNLCTEADGVSSPECLLDYLHHLGVVFHRKGEFGDQIILDQSWALEAVYAVFDRRNSFRQLSGVQGRFTESLLAMMVWQNYTAEQRAIFLGLMTSCGVAFVHRRANEKLGLETEYIAPDLLPEKESVADQMAGRWDETAPHLRLEYDYAFLHPGLVRGLVCDAGEHAGEAGVYWKYGVWVYERDTGCRALIEQQMLDDQRGRIIARVQGSRPEHLCRWIRDRCIERNRQFGLPDLKPTVDEFAPRLLETGRSDTDVRSTVAAARTGTPKFETPPPPAKERPEVFVSYAWGDSTREGIRRKKVVDQLCEALKQAGVHVLRDSEQIQLGERISTFMQRLTQGDLIVTVISEKYLRSANCMYELFQIYRNCADNPDRFLARIVPLVLPCAKIGKTSARLAHAAHWKTEQKEIETVIEANGIDILGPQACAEYRAIREFATNTSDILSYLNDKLAPRDLEALEKTGYAEALALIRQQLGPRDSRD